jgi:hypothetical protein
MILLITQYDWDCNEYKIQFNIKYRIFIPILEIKIKYKKRSGYVKIFENPKLLFQKLNQIGLNLYKN